MKILVLNRAAELTEGFNGSDIEERYRPVVLIRT